MYLRVFSSSLDVYSPVSSLVFLVTSLHVLANLKQSITMFVKASMKFLIICKLAHAIYGDSPVNRGIPFTSVKRKYISPFTVVNLPDNRHDAKSRYYY